MNEKVLLVDDDELLLSSYQRTLRKQFSLDTACGGSEALEKLKSGEQYAVILSDLRMPGMDGLELLRRAHELWPDSVRMILTGNADLRTAIDAVNEGNIFRFLEKPCSGETLVSVLTAALNQHRLVIAEKDLLERTLRGTIKVLTQVLELTNPEASSAASRIAQYARHLVSYFQLKDGWQFDVAAMLSQLGFSVVSQDMRGLRHQEVAYDLLSKIPRLETVAQMIRRQHEPFREQPQIPLQERNVETIGAQILKTCTRFELLVRGGLSFARAADRMLAEAGEYDPVLVAVLRELPTANQAYEQRTVHVRDLTMDMILDEEVRTTSGTLLVCKGVEITDILLARLSSFRERRAIGDLIRVLAPTSSPRHN